MSPLVNEGKQLLRIGAGTALGGAALTAGAALTGQYFWNRQQRRMNSPSPIRTTEHRPMGNPNCTQKPTLPAGNFAIYIGDLHTCQVTGLPKPIYEYIILGWPGSGVLQGLKHDATMDQILTRATANVAVRNWKQQWFEDKPLQHTLTDEHMQARFFIRQLTDNGITLTPFIHEADFLTTLQDSVVPKVVQPVPPPPLPPVVAQEEAALYNRLYEGGLM